MNFDGIVWPYDLPRPLMEALRSVSRVVRLTEDNVFSIGKDLANGLNYVMHGVIIGGITNFQKPAPLVFFKEGTWFGASILYREPDFRYQFTTLDYAEILHVPGNKVKELAAIYPDLYKLLYFVTSERAHETIDALFASFAMTITQKVAYFLLKLAQRYPHVPGASPMLSISQSDFAQILGLSRPKLNQELRALEGAGAISIARKRIYVRDLPVLESVRDGDLDRKFRP